jgi:hypothetical protein
MSFEKNPKDQYPLKSEFNTLSALTDTKIGADGGFIEGELTTDSNIFIKNAKEGMAIIHTPNYNNAPLYPNLEYTVNGSDFVSLKIGGQDVGTPLFIVYSNGFYFSANSGGFKDFYRSSNLSSEGWVKKPVPDKANIYRMAAGNGKLVILTSNGIYVSDDNGDTFQYSSTFNDTNNLSYLGGYFITRGNNYSNTSFQRSQDGMTWTQFSIPFPFQYSWQYAVFTMGAANGKYFIHNTENGSFAVSEDLISWSVYEKPVTESYLSDSNIAGINGSWFILDKFVGRIYKSTDLTSWELISQIPVAGNSHNSQNTVIKTIDNKIIIPVEQSIYTSSDGFTWTTISYSTGLSPWGGINAVDLVIEDGYKSVNSYFEKYQGNIHEDISKISQAIKTITISTLDPVEENITGSDGEIWITYTP